MALAREGRPMMIERVDDMEQVSIELDEDVLEAVDKKAFKDHRENREAALRSLLNDWLMSQDG
jgi:metal-responsive CopG/Arc/MetJ family transcriptional regulator